MASLLGQTYSDIDDLMSQWFSFAVTNGWTQDEYDPISTGDGHGALSKGSIFAQWDWSTSGRLKHYMSTSFSGGTDPGFQTGDAGPFSGERSTLMSFGSGTADFFAGTEQSAEYLVCVAEDSPERFRMWYVGELIKIGDWDGGQIGGNQSWPIFNSFSPILDSAFDSRNKTLFDSIMQENNAGDVVKLDPVEFGFAWGMVGADANPGQDALQNARAPVEGSGRGGPWYSMLNWASAQPNTGFVPLQPQPLHLRSGTSWRLLGFVPGLRGLRITFISPREEFTLGSDTWKAYPWVRKSFANSGTPESDDQGLAFLK